MSSKKQEINWDEVNATMNEEFKQDCIQYGWLEILRNLTGLTKAINSFKDGQGSKVGDFCPIHGGKKGDKFNLLPSAHDDGAGWCFKCAQVVGGINHVMLANNLEYKEAITSIKELIYTDGKQPYPWKRAGIKLSEYQSSPIAPKPNRTFDPEILSDKDKKLAEKRKNDNNVLLSESVGINHDIAQPLRSYFVNRGIENWGEFGDSLRFHPAVRFVEVIESVNTLKDEEEIAERVHKLNFLRSHKFYCTESMALDGTIFCDMGMHPAALFVMRNNNSMKATSLQKIYLSNDGKKMELDGHFDITVKKRTPKIPGVSSIGSSCHIDSPDMVVIGVAEGPETTLAVRSTIGLPMNCTVDAGGLGNWLPNNKTDRVIVFVDKDVSKAGMNAALKLKKRLEAEFIEVILLEPPLDIPKGSKSVDWLDAVQILGISAFPEWLINWEKLEV